MDILFLNHNVAKKGGTYFRAFHAARYLVARGHNVTLLTIAERQRWRFHREVDEGVEIIHSPDLLWGLGRTGWDAWDTLCRINYLRGRRWDIIHAWDCRPVVILPALWARWISRSRGRLIIDWCDWWGRGGIQAERPRSLATSLFAPVETFFEESFRVFADGTTVTSEALKVRALGLGVKPNFLLLPGGSDTDIIQPVDRTEARRALSILPGEWVVGYVGALSLGEVDMLLSAVEKLRTRLPNTRLLAIGVVVAGSSQSFRERVGNRWGDWITETGRIPFNRMKHYLGVCDTLILPMLNTVSNRARWPSKINDYLASGRPIVATCVGEVELLFSQVPPPGLLTAPDPDALADGLWKVISQPELASELGQAGRRLAANRLSWAQLSSQLERFYFDT
jgi:glycosyltransferase involved in cell wall biosynthesis